MTTRPKPKLAASVPAGLSATAQGAGQARERAARESDGSRGSQSRGSHGSRSAAGRGAGRNVETPPATLRLAIGKAGVGLELESPTTVGGVRIAALTTTFRGVKFPVDVSGGVAKFRHRRGELQRIEVEIAARSLERWMAPRLAGILSTRSPDVWVAVGEGAATVCMSIERDEERDEEREHDRAPSHDRAARMSALAPALAFDVHALFDEESAVLVVANARGSHLAGTATAIALAAVEALVGEFAERHGSLFVVRDAARTLAGSFLPEAGARIPATEGVMWNLSARDGDTWFFQAERGAIPSPPTDAAVRARATAALLREGDDALVGGDLERARAAFVSTLERAPRHDEIVRRIVEIDARTPGREEALLALIGESADMPHAPRAPHVPPAAGTVRGELLAAMGDVPSAMAHLERTAHAEPAPALASRAFERAASLAGDAALAAHWLDHALARWPRSVGARWARVRARLTLGRIEEAIADVAHLEALARGARAKHAVWVRAGYAFQAAGLGSRARAIFERALRYEPDDARALAGLGEALVSEGAAARGVAVLTRALGLLQSRGESPGSLLLVLARAFAERLDDAPTAIAHASSIAPEAPEAPVARGLEGRWRAQLGDVVGASLAFARMREMASALAPTPVSLDAVAPASALPRGAPGDRASLLATVVELLREGADVEVQQRGDPLAAQRHLAIALRLAPHDGSVQAAYRAAGASILARSSPASEREPAWEEADAPASEVTVAPAHESPARLDPFADAGEDADDAHLSARADELGRRVQADPRDEAAASELAQVLEALGRGHELLALMMGRLEDAPAERRPELVLRVRAVLERLADAAARAGRMDEATLYRTIPIE